MVSNRAGGPPGDTVVQPTSLERSLGRLGVRTNGSTEWGWAWGRVAVILATAVGTALFLRASPAYHIVLGLQAFVLAYNVALMLLLRRGKVGLTFVVGMLLDNGVLLAGWWAVVRAEAGATLTNDLYLVLFPLLGVGVARLGWRLGTAYTGVWLAWVAWANTHYYPSHSYDVEQLPVRLLFLAIVAALTMRLMSRLQRERLRAEDLLQQTRDREAQISRLNAELEQRVIERTAELSAANRELEAFSYSVSHDLRNHIAVMAGFAELLEARQAASLSDEAKRSLAMIREAGQRMRDIIDDLLRLSMAARGDMRRQPVDLTELARSVAADLAQADPGRRVRFVIADGLAAEGDPGLLRVLLENLLGNAWKYTAKHAQATIELGASEIDGRGPFFVRDDGAGFDMAAADRLFVPFQRLHSPEEFPGTGIGLTTVQRIVERHGGRVWAQAEVEKGATFYFTLAPWPTLGERTPPRPVASAQP